MSKSNKSLRQKEVHEKIRELKQKQDSWLKQRAESKDPIKTEKKSQFSSPAPEHQKPKTTGSDKGFHAWVSRRNKAPDKTQPDTNSSTRYGQSSEELPHSSPESDLSTHSSLCSTRLDNYEDNVNPDDFDARANKIANRVKQKLNLETNPTEAGLESERRSCPMCQTVMVGSHYPLAMPCGHTVCSVCSSTLTHCPICHMSSHDLTSNARPQQINNNSNLTQNHRKQASSLKLSEDWENRFEEHRNLLVRCEVLESEGSNIETRIDSLEREKSEQLQQVNAIKREEDKIHQQIANLQLRLQSLEDHKREYYETHESLERKQTEERRKYGLVQDTLHALRQDATKLQHLLESRQLDS